MPIHALVGAWLLVQLLHQGLHGLEVFLLWIVLIHPCHEVACANLVEVVIIQSVVSDNAL